MTPTVQVMLGLTLGLIEIVLPYVMVSILGYNLISKYVKGKKEYTNKL